VLAGLHVVQRSPGADAVDPEGRQVERAVAVVEDQLRDLVSSIPTR
jgi:hypothetical protein